MIDEMANHGNRIRRYMDRFGVEVVESFIDVCLSIEDLIDVHSPFIKRFEGEQRYRFREHIDQDDLASSRRFQAKSYMDAFVNPSRDEADSTDDANGDPPSTSKDAMRDVMLFLLQHAPLKPWHVDVLSMIRDESYYFAPGSKSYCTSNDIPIFEFNKEFFFGYSGWLYGCKRYFGGYYS